MTLGEAGMTVSGDCVLCPRFEALKVLWANGESLQENFMII